MDGLERRYPGRVKVIQIGKTYENHAIKMIRIGANPNLDVFNQHQYSTANQQQYAYQHSNHQPANQQSNYNRINNKYSADIDKMRSEYSEEHEFLPRNESAVYGPKPAIWLDAGIHAR